MLQIRPPDRVACRADGQLMPCPKAPYSPEKEPGILVVDDEFLMRDMLQRSLQYYGFRVWPAADGWQALALYQQLGEDVAVVLLDVRMPGLDGPQTLSALQRVNPDVCCCFMSGHTGDYETDDLLERGAVRVFTKPFQLDEVVEILWQLAGGVARGLGPARPPAWNDWTAPRSLAGDFTRKDGRPWTVAPEQFL